ncbi:hypothetical protein F511_30275 [Dorcoceras hygrometricum]|uniref:Uncharacterized protein n=1 Tax=Dorcoceras hygrometricum TaxID=472368 RepID=A0A2Z7BBN8_9LAMI|nr:hypothetical protein F511_30275 [Dorcoceras hygrometricum]
MTFRVVRTNQYNQDLRLIHSTNGNHLESPNEGSSIDHQVTIYLDAQNITMFPTNETWQTTPAPEGQWVKPQYGEQYRTANGKQQVICNMPCMRTRLQPKRREPKDLKELLNNSNRSTEKQKVATVCEYMGATQSSPHTEPDAQPSSACCCPTHEVWELPTPLIVANRSQQGDEVRELPAQPQQHPGVMFNTETYTTRKTYTAASIITHAQSKAVKQAHIRTSSLLCYNYYSKVPSNTDLSPAKPSQETTQEPKHRKQQLGARNSTSAILPLYLNREL